MIALAILADAATFMRAPYYDGPMSPLEASCEIVLKDHRIKTIALSFSGAAKDRLAHAVEGNVQTDTPVEVTTLGKVKPGKLGKMKPARRHFLNEVVTLPDEVSGSLRYGFRYVWPSPDPLIPMEAWAVLPDGKWMLNGMGLCWTKGAAQ